MLEPASTGLTLQLLRRLAAQHWTICLPLGALFLFVFRKIGIVLTSGSRGAVGRTELGSICGEMSRHPGAWETRE